MTSLELLCAREVANYFQKALNIFNAALVTPTYYVCFTSSTIVTSAILFRGFKGTPSSITTYVGPEALIFSVLIFSVS